MSPAVDAVRAGGRELDRLGRGRFDVVSWDPRGAGASTRVRCFANPVTRAKLDSVVDPVAFTTSVAATITSNIVDTDSVFAKFLSLCQRAGPARCALAGRGPVAARVNRLLARLRRGPIPAPSATPPRLTYGDLLLD